MKAQDHYIEPVLEHTIGPRLFKSNIEINAAQDSFSLELRY